MLNSIRQSVTALLAEWRRQAGIERLGALSDALLTDLGLHRGQLSQLGKHTPVITREQQPLSQPEPWPELLPCG